MRRHVRGCAVVLVSLLCLSGRDTAETQTLHKTGQNVQPVFEGWQRRPDGSFDMVFGYLNRNYVEESEVPVGVLNSFSPGPADRGQPTHFYPRRQSFVFRVTVPANWTAKQDLVWTVTHHGKTARAYGSLWPSWEIDEGVWKANRGAGIAGRTTKQTEANAAPIISIVGESAVTVAQSRSLELSVSVSDDGRPGPTGRSGRAPTPSTATGVPGIAPSVGPASQDLVQVRSAQETGLAVSWLHYRGAGTVTFEPRVVPIKSEGKAVAGRASTTVRFSGPGTYVLRAFADDGIYTTPVDVTVVVTANGRP